MTVHALRAHRSEIRLAGSGGQGLITGMHILFRALALEGKRAAQSQSYEPTSRGGFCYSDLVVSDDSGDYPLATQLDMVAALSQVGLDRSLSLIKPGALLIVDERLAPDPPKAGFDLYVLPIAARAVEAGSPRIANVVALGALARLGRLVADEVLEQAVRLETPPKFADLNLAALREGRALAGALAGA
jgi:2-oxoglutarate ferredoxin oxidoreductase subunit gamma